MEIAQVLEPFARGQFSPAALPVDQDTVASIEGLKQTQSLFQFEETEIQPVMLASKSTPGLPKSSFEKWLGLWIAGGATLALLILLLLLKLVLG
jgi:hypothetical protein